MAGPLLESVPGPGGARLLRLHGPGGAYADVSEYGAHVVSWRDAGGRERLFLSPDANFGAGQAIRGGVPVIFPQFAGRGALAKHGFARNRPWRTGLAERFDDGSAGLRFTLEPDAGTRAAWPHEFEATLDLRLAAHALEIGLAVHNRGATAFAFTAALHSYLAVADIAQATLSGLQDRPYEDSAGGAWRVQAEPALRFEGELDRIYPDVRGPLQLACAQDSLRIEAEGFPDVVVWNPGAELAAALSDLRAGRHRHFVCVEAAAVLSPVVLAPGGSWSGRQRLLVSA